MAFGESDDTVVIKDDREKERREEILGSWGNSWKFQKRVLWMGKKTAKA